MCLLPLSIKLLNIFFFQFINSSEQNRYECHVFNKDTFNLTPNGPVHATDFIIVDSTINLLKMLYGEAADPNNVLPTEMGRTEQIYYFEVD